MTTPADEIYLRRCAYRLSMDEVARACGVTVWALFQIEKGKHRGTTDRLVAVYRYLFADALRNEKRFITNYIETHGQGKGTERATKPKRAARIRATSV